MKEIKKLFVRIKDFNHDFMLNQEKITIINRNKILVQNYEKILEIDDKIIKLLTLTIKGNNLKLKAISKYYLEITGIINFLEFGDKNEK